MTATVPETAAAAPRRAWPPRLGRLLLATASGLALYLSFAPRDLWWLAPLAFTGLGLALHGRRVRAGLGLGFVFGLVFFLPLLVWLNDFLGAEFGPWPWLGLSVALAAYLGLAGGLVTVVSRLPGAPVWMAAVYIALETPRAWFPLGGFPWGRVAFSQPEGAFLPLAAVGGAPLVGFAVTLAGFGLAILLARSRRVRHPRALAGPALATVLPVVAGLALWPAVGAEPQSGTLTVAVVQGNAPDVGLALQGRRAELRANHLAESERLLADVRAGRVPRPDLVVWPESATDIRGSDPRLDRLVADFGVPFLVGGLYWLPDGTPQNVVVVWDPDTGRGARYAKQELVPFGEYIPARAIARLVTPFVDDTGDMRPGDGDPAALRVAGTVVGTIICYEAAYDYPARDAVRAGAELLTAPTNNAWYGPGEMSYQQLAMSRLRAVEHGRAVVVAATSGVSAIVRPDGGVARSTDLFTAASLVAEVPLRRATTLSDRLGAWPEYVLVGVAVAAALAGVAPGRRAGAPGGDTGHGGTDTAARPAG
ncbi:apolipoprotein N-acyltransferase [Amycolatopsis arida]|uniref:Apolipoprotein N-acyltransferase n=1 Tax=Amycolatopsis arida TaxID=587909 RepID=A0A1I5ZFU4_9PSEU|nr:apolipoprotein N-acyltransferase [Amycolatopsis arida]TDX89638.1 apolipoprotein N-acyltransferase [Amycolatopsis arida]SFQ55315.1 apolipoprotein N-acyltransferase [Amycolatopsis arida]